MSLHVLVLAGGSGTRLWPLSRQAMPKHLLPLGPGGTTLLRATVERVAELGDSINIVTAADQVELCRRALDGIDNVGIIAEPQARGTGPALGLATQQIAREDPDATIVSVHADHHVGDVDNYRAAVLASAGWAATTQGLATVGVAPTFPAIGFGYIQTGEVRPPQDWLSPCNASDALAGTARGLSAHQSLGFVEKPPLEVAKQYVDSGDYLWNVGLFAWPARVFQSELQTANPQLAEALAKIVEARAQGDNDTANAKYASLNSAPVEPLVFEHTPQLTVVHATFAWSDLGSWSDLRDADRADGDNDADGNVVLGDGLIVDSRNCLVSARSGRLVSVVGVDDLVVVDSGDAVLVVPASQAQKVKEVVERLTENERSDLL